MLESQETGTRREILSKPRLLFPQFSIHLLLAPLCLLLFPLILFSYWECIDPLILSKLHTIDWNKKNGWCHNKTDLHFNASLMARHLEEKGLSKGLGLAISLQNHLFTVANQWNGKCPVTSSPFSPLYDAWCCDTGEVIHDITFTAHLHLYIS